MVPHHTRAKAGWRLSVVLTTAVVLCLVCAGQVLAVEEELAGPAGSGAFGTDVTVLPSGNIVVTDPAYDLGALADAGAVYLYDGKTGALISMLTGAAANDRVGSGGAVVLPNGNYVVSSPDWASGAAGKAGAVTWGSGTNGVAGVVAAGNSLVGSQAGDHVGSICTRAGCQRSVEVLLNGNYVVNSPEWANGAADNAGAVTWGSGANGVAGAVAASNSLVGSQAGDHVGSICTLAGCQRSVEVLPNGNYVVNSPEWANGAADNAGAVTWGSGANGVAGAVAASNSLVGSQAGDHVGCQRSVEVLPNGNYVVSSPEWANGAADNAGAVTWGSGANGVAGAVAASNSLVGSQAVDRVGSGGVNVLANGNYVVSSPYWANGAAKEAGAVTWRSGAGGIVGVVAVSNSLVGSQAGDYVGGVTALANGNYVVSSPFWANGAAENAGAATWGSGASGIVGVVAASNSLVGSQAGDEVGGVTALANGNYVVSSPYWANGATQGAGAVTWGSGAIGVAGVVAAGNSLVGSQTDDHVGSICALGRCQRSVEVLPNGNYVVSSPEWANGAAERAGAVTWVSGAIGGAGVVAASNSLVGSQAGDYIGAYCYGVRVGIMCKSSITVLANGNYVVSSPYWANGATQGAGAVTWGSGANGIAGVVSPSNSLVGGQGESGIGDTYCDILGCKRFSVLALPNGNYVVSSPEWAHKAGAVTWGSGATGVAGVVAAGNSLVGSQAGDGVGGYCLIEYDRLYCSGAVTVLANGNYVVTSPHWANGAADKAGAATWGSGASGVAGVVAASNSLVGSQAGDEVGNHAWVHANGDYVVSSPYWANGTAKKAGAVTWGNGVTGITGVVAASNSLVGSQADDRVGGGEGRYLANGNYVVSSPYWANGAAKEAGAVTWRSGANGVAGVVAASNSLVGSHADDEVGSGGVEVLANGSYVIKSPVWANGTIENAGAVTLGDGAAGTTGAITRANSVLGGIANGGNTMNDVYDYVNPKLVVGRPQENRVSLFAPTKTQLSATPALVFFGQAVTFTAAVTALAPGGGIPIGAAAFAVDGGAPAPVPLDGNGNATYTRSDLSAGLHSVVAAYTGVSNPSMSAEPLTQMVSTAAVYLPVVNR